MTKVAVIGSMLLSLPATFACGQSQDSRDPTRVSFDAPRSAIVMGADIAATGWPPRLAMPSEEGQFEVLVSKDAAPFQAPGCIDRYLIVRMPGSIAIGDNPGAAAAVARKRQAYTRLLQAYREGQSIHFEVFAGAYGKRLTGGQVALTGCNLFFTEPGEQGR